MLWRERWGREGGEENNKREKEDTIGWVKRGYGLIGGNQMGFQSGSSIMGETPMTVRVQKGAEVLRRIKEWKVGKWNLR